MRGWLVINSFAQTDDSQALFGLLKDAAEEKGVELITRRTVDLTCPVGEEGEMELPDFVIFWDKDVLLARRLEQAGLRLFNSASAIETCDSKALCAIALSRENVPAPRTYISPKTFEYFGYNDLSFLSEYGESLGYPYVIKEEFGSFGLNVSLVKNREEAAERVEKMGFRTFVAQEYIEESAGHDLRCYVVGDRVVASMLRENKNDFRSNIFQGGQGTAYEISPEEEELAVMACRAVGCDFCGVDILVGEGISPLVCEVNSNAHFTGLLRCTGINMAPHIIGYVRDHVLQDNRS
ncbi:MAG: RimK family alpha-L-glutamate ligase [Lachnospiraceae bacterium]|nr:RimK family alpha-L-glutamate ligase [Lachnospiraceae bacterium]